MVANFYDTQLSTMKTWFEAWYQLNCQTKERDRKEIAKKVEFNAQLFFPASWMDNAKAFAKSTKFLMYNGKGHLGDKPPISVSRGRLDNDINRRFGWFTPECVLLTHV